MKRGSVPNATFNPAHIAATNPRTVRKFFLRQPLVFAERAESHAKFLQGRMPGWLTGLAGHSPHAGSSRPFGPRPIRYNEYREPTTVPTDFGSPDFLKSASSSAGEEDCATMCPWRWARVIELDGRHTSARAGTG